MALKDIFDGWADETQNKYAHRQWLLSKWEVVEGVNWPEQKIDIMIKSIVNGLELKKDEVLLDIGCGGGWISEKLYKSTRKVYSLDISQQMLKNARSICPSNTLICADIKDLPFRKEMFGYCLCYFVFINFTDDQEIERGLLEIMRILKKGGRAFIGQLPDSKYSSEYDAAKRDYSQYCADTFKMEQNIGDHFRPPIHLFDRDLLGKFFNKQRISFTIRDSFNPFYREGQPEFVPWRFDLILKKV